MSNSQSALANLALLALSAAPEQKPITKPVNNATNPSVAANLAVAALGALATTALVDSVQDNTAELFDVEAVESLEVVVIINGASYSVFSI
jgi:methyl coenzyme M reductase subunit C